MRDQLDAVASTRQHTQELEFHVSSGIRNRNLNMRGAPPTP